jgi:hypothetical protein
MTSPSNSTGTPWVVGVESGAGDVVVVGGVVVVVVEEEAMVDEVVVEGDGAMSTAAVGAHAVRATAIVVRR